MNDKYVNLPWTAELVSGGTDPESEVRDSNGHLVATFYLPFDADYTVSRVNYCAGINPEAVPDLVKALEDVVRINGSTKGAQGVLDELKHRARAALAKIRETA